MKISSCCGKCGSRAQQVTVKVSAKDANAFLAFENKVRESLLNSGREETVNRIFIPPSRYPKQALVIPSPKEDPCQHCKLGEESMGPNSCGQAINCLAFAYYKITQIEAVTGEDAESSLKSFLIQTEFTDPNDPKKTKGPISCDVSHVTLVKPPRKKQKRRATRVAKN